MTTQLAKDVRALKILRHVSTLVQLVYHIASLVVIGLFITNALSQEPQTDEVDTAASFWSEVYNVIFVEPRLASHFLLVAQITMLTTSAANLYLILYPLLTWRRCWAPIGGLTRSHAFDVATRAIWTAHVLTLAAVYYFQYPDFRYHGLSAPDCWGIFFGLCMFAKAAARVAEKPVVVVAETEKLLAPVQAGAEQSAPTGKPCKLALSNAVCGTIMLAAVVCHASGVDALDLGITLNSGVLILELSAVLVTLPPFLRSLRHDLATVTQVLQIEVDAQKAAVRDIEEAERPQPSEKEQLHREAEARIQHEKLMADLERAGLI